MVLSDGCVSETRFSVNQGFGLRAVCGAMVGFAHSPHLSDSSLARAVSALSPVSAGYAGHISVPPSGRVVARYDADNPLSGLSVAQKAEILGQIDAYARQRDPRVSQVTVSLLGNWQVIAILRPDGFMAFDLRPQVRLRVEVEASQNGRVENGTQGIGGRFGYENIIGPSTWQDVTRRAVDRALVNLQAGPAPAGKMVVVLGPGKNGILLHEAVGHGLEGDGNRRGTSSFTGMLGMRVAPKGVTVVDDGTLTKTRGAISLDDEGTPSSQTVLIEDGILVNYLQDRMNGRLMGSQSTGNGRRENCSFPPMPRMTNTYMLNGQHDPAEIIAAAGTGLYVADMNGGTVDFGNKFTFNATECYAIENGKLGRPVKNVTIQGQGAMALNGIRMVGNDYELDAMGGLCGKDNQYVPVGNGQPTLMIEGLMVGGTDS